MGSRALADTNILIDLLAGQRLALTELRAHDDLAISVVSRIELLVGLREDERARAESMLRSFEVIELTPAIAEEAVRVRQTTRLKLADAIILATAHVERRLLLTRNSRDFKAGRFVRIPYKL